MRTWVVRFDDVMRYLREQGWRRAIMMTETQIRMPGMCDDRIWQEIVRNPRWRAQNDNRPTSASGSDGP